MIKGYLIKAAVLAAGLAALCVPAEARRLVILHTNDTHSAIEPDAQGRGGILQRKAVIDSVRAAEKNVFVVDAGDMVQGSLFFKYFRGDVEYPLMDMAGYDLRLLGNHEFDNGMADLAKKYKSMKSIPLGANYDFAGTEMEGVLQPYVIKKIDGKKIGFIGLNINPESLIAKSCIDVKFNDVIPVANELAHMLKHDKKCDVVVAVTHIGYTSGNGKTSDVDLARASRDIDLIIGGHSHTLVDTDEMSLVPNADRRMVRVVQAGKSGQYVGRVEIDLDNLNGLRGEDIGYSLIPVTDRFPQEKLDKRMIAFLEPYREAVDSVNARVIGVSEYDMVNNDRKGGMGNMTADFGLWYANHKADSLRAAGTDIGRVDMSIMNVGGIRQSMPKGDITEGQILSTYPFSNRFTIISLKGADIIEALRIAALKGGEAISRNVRVVTGPDRSLERVIIDGTEMDPEKTYLVGTIDYIAEGNDDLRTLANHRKVWVDPNEVCVPILRWFEHQRELGLPIAPDQNPRFVVDVNKR